MNKKSVDTKRQELLDKAQEMATYVECACKTAQAAHEVEESLFRKALEIGHHAFEMFFFLSGNGDEGEFVTLSDGRRVRRLDESHKREYLSVFGLFELFRVVYGTREGQKIDYVPLDARLKLPQSKYSYLLQDWDQFLVVETPYAKVSRTIAKILGFTQSVNSLERTNRNMSEMVKEYWDSRPVPPAEQEGALLVCSADGKGIPIRREVDDTEEPAQKPHSYETAGKEGKEGKKKMSLVGAAYTVDPYIRTPEQVLNALFQTPETDSPPPSRPEPLFKEVRASLLRDISGTSQPSYDEIFGWLSQGVMSRNPAGEKPTVFIMDGQESLWKALPRYLPKTPVIGILDLLHVCSYVWMAAHLFYKKESTAALRFAREYIYRILKGHVQGVIRGLRWKGTHEGLSRKKLEKLEKIAGYFENNSHRMAYTEYLAAGYPIASGVIEGACRYVVKDRMERTGMRWVLDGAQSMLGLRCIHLSGHWDDFVRFRIRRECERLYPDHAANDDAFEWIRAA